MAPTRIRSLAQLGWTEPAKPPLDFAQLAASVEALAANDKNFRRSMGRLVVGCIALNLRRLIRFAGLGFGNPWLYPIDPSDATFGHGA